MELYSVDIPTDTTSRINAAYEFIKEGKFEEVDFSLIKEAREIGAKLCGIKKVKLFSFNNEKIAKSNRQGKDFSIIMHLAPHKLSGYNACPMASQGCIRACLNTSGHGAYSSVQKARIKKTKLFFEHRALFAIILAAELEQWNKAVKKKGKKLAVRCNGTSDIIWEKIFPWMFSQFSDVTFYDYSKIDKRFKGKLPENYTLTFSRGENNKRKALQIINQGHNVAVVFTDLNKAIQEGHKGYRVIDGVSTDRRYDDNKSGVVVGLKSLAKARNDMSGFVVRN